MCIRRMPSKANWRMSEWAARLARRVHNGYSPTLAPHRSPGTLEGELFQMLGEDGDDETMTATSTRDGLAAGAATTTAPAQGTLRFNAANQLYRDAAPKTCVVWRSCSECTD